MVVSKKYITLQKISQRQAKAAAKKRVVVFESRLIRNLSPCTAIETAGCHSSQLPFVKLDSRLDLLVIDLMFSLFVKFYFHITSVQFLSTR